MFKRVKIATVPFDAVTHADVLSFVEHHVENNKGVYITTPNPEMVMEAEDNHEFSDVLKNAALSIPDGIGILWASYYLSLPIPKGRLARVFQVITSLFAVLRGSKKIKQKLPARVTGADILFRIIEQSQEHKWKAFLLGAKPGVAKRAIHKLLEKYPKAIFAGSHAGSPDLDEEEDIVEIINHSKPDILFVAYGSPAQELWIHRNLFKLDTVKVAIGVGGAIDFAAGIQKRAPKFMQNIGLEWLYRLIKEPKRIKRIWNATFVFVLRIYKFKKGS